ncbi:MAG TPA: hypothetical protein VFR90_09045 [Methylibium sp.]|uniref:hypothetical protein n=1 Tax=Methylibium sp. TaxID=2067992 RepID=UPI002DB5C63B|nr:hypothetical protein [Methylibium sp.]HEU4459253.1 hypothetical protein [Methylibium sp.]
MKRPDTLSIRIAGRRIGLLPCLFAAGALVAGASAQAQSSPYSLLIGQRFGVDSNIFRVSNNEQRDYYSLTSVTVGLDQPISRQRLYASATADYTAWKGNDQLNGPGYNVLAGLGWEVGSRLTGDVRFNLRQAQANPADYGALSGIASQKNRERSGTFDFRGAYGGIGLLAIETLYNHTNIDYSNDAFATRERKSDTLGAGLRVRQTPDLNYGFMWRETRGEYPRGVVVPGGFLRDEYDRRDIDLSAGLRLSELTAFSGRVSYTKEDHDQIAARSFSGVTGEIAAVYRPTGKLELGASLSRDTGSGNQSSQLAAMTGAGTTGSTGGTPTGTATGTPGIVTGGTGLTGGTTSGTTGTGTGTSGYLTDARVSDRIRVSAQWDATAKVRVNTALTYARERYDTLFVTGTTGSFGQEKGSTRAAMLGARYEFSRAISFECGVGYESRDAGALVNDYDATTGYCGAALLLQ